MDEPLATVFLNDQLLKNGIFALLRHSQRDLKLITPYFDPPPRLLNEILAARRRGVVVALVLRRDVYLTPRALATVKQLRGEGVTVGDVDWLHTKMYISENEAIVSSLNLVEASFNESREAGCRFPASLGPFRDALTYADSLIRESAPQSGPGLWCRSPEQHPMSSSNERQPLNEVVGAGSLSPEDRRLCQEDSFENEYAYGSPIPNPNPYNIPNPILIPNLNLNPNPNPYPNPNPNRMPNPIPIPNPKPNSNSKPNPYPYPVPLELNSQEHSKDADAPFLTLTRRPTLS